MWLGTMFINFAAEPMPHEKKNSGRAYAENKLSVQTKFDSSPHPQNQIVARRLVVKLRSKGPKV